MRKEKEYLIDRLKKAGVKGNVFTSLKKMEMSRDLQMAGVMVSGEVLTRSGSKTKYTDEEGRRRSRHKLWKRVTKMHVVIADTTDEKVEAILEKFLCNIKKGIAVDGNWVDIEIGELDWVDEKDSILKAKVAVQFDVTFTGGIYADYVLKKVAIDVKEAE